jgi:hypothetical protein
MPVLKKRKIAHESGEDSADTGSSDNEVSSPKAVSDNNEEAGQNGEAQPAPKTFKDLGLIDPLCEACENLGYKTPTPIQAEAIPLALQGALQSPRLVLVCVLNDPRRSGSHRTGGNGQWKDSCICSAHFKRSYG